MPEGFLIGELCRRAGCTPRTIRHYEAEGLFAPEAITPGGRRLYGEETVSILGMAQVLRKIGYSLKDIREILSLTKSAKTRERRLTLQLRGILSASLSQIDTQIKLLSSARGRIRDLLERTQKCPECGSSDCAPCGKLKDLRTLGLLT